MNRFVTDQRQKEFIEAAHRVAQFGLARCSSGNLSMRIEGNHLLIKASRTWMGDLDAGGLAVCRISDGAHIFGPKPSVETGFHAGILRERPDVEVVLHFQTPHATAISCRGDADRINYAVIPEVPFYIGPVATVPYLPPGSPELARDVTAAARGHDMVILRNHGQVTVGKTLNDAIQKAAFFELACEVILRAWDCLKPLGDDAVRALRAAAGNHGGA